MRRRIALVIALSLALPLAAPAPAPVLAADSVSQSAKAGRDATSRTVQQVGSQADSAARASEAHGISRWVWVALAVLIIVLLVALLSRRRRRQAVIRSRIG